MHCIHQNNDSYLYNEHETLKKEKGLYRRPSISGVRH